MTLSERTRNSRGRGVRFGGLVLLTLALAASAGESVRVTTTDGRVIFGELRTSRPSKALLVRTAPRDIYLSSHIVKKIDRAAAIGEMPAYTLAANVKLVRSTPKKGTINPVVREFKLTPFDEKGRAAASLLDPKLGKVSFTVAITRITLETYEFEGVEYQQKLGFPCSLPNGFWKRMVFKQVDLENAKSLVKAIDFFTRAGDDATVRELLGALEKVSPRAAAEQRGAAAGNAVRKALRQVERLELLGLHRKAGQLATTVRADPNSQLLDADLKAQLDAKVAELKDMARIFANAEKVLASAGLAGTKPSAAQARRVLKAAAMGIEGTEALTKHDLLIVLAPWSGALFDEKKVTREMLIDARTLAEAAAAYFAAEWPGDAGKLGRQFADTPLPMAVKVAIFSQARTPVPMPAKAAARGPITYTHPRTREKYHYYITLPPNYDPSRPTAAVVCLHGQNSKAGVMSRFWGRTAGTNGMIIIDPEYIYGRTHGYRFSQQAHHAVTGALADATRRCNIDTDRVFLSGHSQGGHACWDMGGAHAGRFAGVLPVIGAPVLKNMLPNYIDTALYSIDGSDDGSAPARNRNALKTLGTLRCDATYIEYRGRGHEGFSEEFDAASLWMLRHRRDGAPKFVHLVALRNCDRRRRWVEIQGTYKLLNPITSSGRMRISPEPTTATVLASVRGNTFAVHTANVLKMRVLLSPRLIDFSRKVTVQLNGRYARPQAVKPDWKFALEDSFRRRDRQEVYLGEIVLDVRTR